MMTEEGFVEAPATITYAELVDNHLDRIFPYIVLLIGDRKLAETETLAAFRRVWEDLDQGKVFGDAEEILYRTATRSALRRLARSQELRGHLPPTTADDRLITATGIISELGPDQRAAVLLAAWGKVGYELAGVASGVGAGRARDLAFGARQEYRQERGGPPDASSACYDIVPLLSARADGTATTEEEERIAAHLTTCPTCPQTARLFEEFGALVRGMRLPVLSAELAEEVRNEPQAQRRRAPTGWRRVLRLASGPALLTIVLIVGFAVIQSFGGEPSIKTGGGRTSDILYARDAAGALVIVDAGSGRQIGRVPVGALTEDGRQVYSSASSCTDGACRTTVRVTDTGTLETTDVGRVEGRLAIVGADGGAGRLYLADEDAGAGRLAVYDLSTRRVQDTLAGPAEVQSPFTPASAEATADRAALFSVGARAASGPPVVVRTDLRAPRVAGTVDVPNASPDSIDLHPTADGGRALAYQPASGQLDELDPATGQVLRTVNLSGRAAPDASTAGGGSVQSTLAVGPGDLAYAVLRTGGIAVVDLARFEVLRRLNADRDYTTVSVSSDGRTLYVVDSNGAYVVLDANTGDILLRRDNARLASMLQVNRGE